MSACRPSRVANEDTNPVGVHGATEDEDVPAARVRAVTRTEDAAAVGTVGADVPGQDEEAEVAGPGKVAVDKDSATCSWMGWSDSGRYLDARSRGTDQSAAKSRADARPVEVVDMGVGGASSSGDAPARHPCCRLETCCEDSLAARAPSQGGRWGLLAGCTPPSPGLVLQSSGSVGASRRLSLGDPLG